MKAVPHQQLTLELETKHVKTYLLNNLAFVFLRRLLGWFLPRKLGILLPSQLWQRCLSSLCRNAGSRSPPSTTVPEQRTDVGCWKRFNLFSILMSIFMKSRFCNNSLLVMRKGVTVECSDLHCNPSDFPNNSQLSMHYKEFLKGYRSSAESVMIKFPFSDGSRRLDDFAVGCVDGFSKILLMMSIVSFVDELEMSPEAIAASQTLTNCLKSFSLVRCSYDHGENPQKHFLESLRNYATIFIGLLFLFWSII